MTAPTRVAMISVHTCPLAVLGGKHTGGMNVYIRELAGHLSQRGIYVDVFTRSQDPCVPHIDSATLGERARVIHIPAGPEAPMSTAATFDYLSEFTENVLAFAAKDGLEYSLIHSHYWLSGLVAEALREAWQVPFIQMFHTLALMKNRIAAPDETPEPQRRVDSEMRLVTSADALVAATPVERTQLMWLYNAPMQNIEIIPPGVDLTQFHPIRRDVARRKIGIPSDQHRLLLFVGRIERLKGLDTLLQAVSHLKHTAPHLVEDTCLAIIGGDLGELNTPDTELGRLNTLRSELGLEEFVAFLGSRSQETLPYYYAAADLLVMPSHYESFGMVALEAMACGTPVIASEVGGLAHLIKDGVNGLHVPDRDLEELAGKIRLLLEDGALRAEIASQAVGSAAKYSWPRITSQVMALYSRVMASGFSLVPQPQAMGDK